jgi:hypothetical protein
MYSSKMIAFSFRSHFGAWRRYQWCMLKVTLLYWYSGMHPSSVVTRCLHVDFLLYRVLMGIGEAGYYAGMIYYLSFWYKR